jgi:hypothetical protein
MLETQDGVLAEPGKKVSLEILIRRLHQKLRIHGGLAPGYPTTDVPAEVTECRIRLLEEECGELVDALRCNDLVGIADGVADVMTAAAGIAVPYGLPLDALLRLVFASNATKTNDPGQQKLAKGPGYEAPRIPELLGIAKWCGDTDE